MTSPKDSSSLKTLSEDIFPGEKRKTTGSGVGVMTRLQPDMLEVVDDVIASSGFVLSRPEVLRTAFREWATERRLLSGPSFTSSIKLDCSKSWALAGLTTAQPWTATEEKIEYGGREFVLLPQQADYFPAVAVQRQPDERLVDAWTTLNKFLSFLCWATEGVFSAPRLSETRCGPFPMTGFRRWGQHFMPYYAGGSFQIRMLPKVDENAAIALAFWREGCALEIGEASPHYAFLSFFKVVERAFSAGKMREMFIADALPRISVLRTRYAELAQREINDLESEGQDPNVYMYASCRCAAAHARASDVVANPDSVADADRLSNGTPIIKSLAHICIVEEYGVPSPQELRHC